MPGKEPAEELQTVLGLTKAPYVFESKTIEGVSIGFANLDEIPNFLNSLQLYRNGTLPVLHIRRAKLAHSDDEHFLITRNGRFEIESNQLLALYRELDEFNMEV